MERIDYLTLLTKQYYNESQEFYFEKRHLNLRKPVLKLVYSAYNVEYSLVMKDFRIFFENKLKTKFYLDTRLSRESKIKRFITNKYLIANQNLNDFKYYTSNFDYSEIAIKQNVVFSYSVDLKKKMLNTIYMDPKVMTKTFFFKQMIKYQQSKYPWIPLRKLGKKVKKPLEVFEI